MNLRAKSVLSTGLLGLLSLVLPGAIRASDITYNVNLNVGVGSVTGTITTDGTTGVLGATNLVGWTLAVNDGTPLTTLEGPTSGSNSFADVSGNDLTATATQLLFNYSGTDLGFFQIGAADTSSWFCNSTGINCDSSDVPPDITLNDELTGTSTYSPETGDQVIGTVSTPEPGNFSLMLIGIGFVLVMREL